MSWAIPSATGPAALRTPLIMALALLAAVADVLTPLYAGKLIDAVASRAAGDAQVWHGAMTAFWLLVALGLPCCCARPCTTASSASRCA